MLRFVRFPIQSTAATKSQWSSILDFKRLCFVLMCGFELPIKPSRASGRFLIRASQPASQLVSQPASRPASQPGSQPARQVASQPASWPASEPSSQLASELARQPVAQTAG